MLIIFKSPASGDVNMLEKNAQELLSLLGKNPDDRQGVITVEQLPAAINAIQAAIAADKARPKNNDESDDEAEPEISLAQRALPLLQLLQNALKEKAMVTWGV
jgi:spore cortex formation protein SpoVR/YcgB (stage V sporulation)